MSDLIRTDICVIGAGSGGLSVAAGAAQMGADVVLIEKGEMGGDCLNSGCVPSKALLAAAERVEAVRDANRFGIDADIDGVDWQAVHDHVQEVIAAIAPNDSQQRFEGLGVRVVRAAARFEDRRTVTAGGLRIRARYFVLATGSSPFVPPIPGLAEVPWFTNETIFGNRERVGHLIVVGGGPIGMEMAQAYRRLGAEVTVIEAARLLPKDDPELASIVIERLYHEGVTLFEGARDLRFEQKGGDIIARFETGDGPQYIEGSHLLIATGRRANVDGLDLEKAGVRYTPRGVETDMRLRTGNRRVYAVGDVAGPYQFTHMAAYQAGIAIRNMLFKLPARVDYCAVPWVTYTDPELAHVGLTEAEARQRHGEVRVLKWSFTENDRAQAERRTEGMIKVVVSTRGRILGATIASLHGGELIQPWVLAVSRRMKIGAMASVIAPYPTLGEVGKRVAGSFYTPKLFSEKTGRLVRLLLKWLSPGVSGK